MRVSYWIYGGHHQLSQTTEHEQQPPPAVCCHPAVTCSYSHTQPYHFVPSVSHCRSSHSLTVSLVSDPLQRRPLAHPSTTACMSYN